MSYKADLSSLSWLSALVAGHRARVQRLLGKLNNLGAVQAMTPGIFKKFMHLLDQVAAEQDKETATLSLIECIESRHRYRRAHNQLIQADSSIPLFQPCFGAATAPGRKPKSGFWLLLLLLFTSPRKPVQHG